MDPDVEARVAVMLQNAEAELWAKGYTADQAAAAIKTARRWAQGIADQVRPTVRDAVYEDLLIKRLEEPDRWLQRMRGGLGAGIG